MLGRRGRRGRCWQGVLFWIVVYRSQDTGFSRAKWKGHQVTATEDLMGSLVELCPSVGY